ncbi:SpoIIE family protein phosphatase [Pseudomonas aeruginosa]|nr:SpoIIE family protein phosphatase [Pseudomonas aeruginosa]
MAANWGLRGKSVVALLLACALALVPAVLLGWRAMDDIRTHFGLAYAKNFTLLHRQKILAPVSRELALSRRFAESVVTRDWLLKEDDPARRALFFREAEGYRGDFRDHAYFIIASGSQHYYFNDGSQPYSERPRYTLEAGDPEDAWYFNTLRNSAAYNINVNVDSKLNLTKVWFNLVIRDQGRPIGLAGSGLDLSGFLDDFIIAREPGVTPMIVGDDGAIQAHPDRRLIAYSSAAGGASERHRVFDLLDQPEQRDALREAMRLARAKAGSVHCLWAGLDGRQLSATLGEHHFILWKPRDVVGGDFYVYREQADGYLIGVVDCAGHGVPGALMTMLARAAIDHAIEAVGSRDPAAILGETDQAMRSMLSQEQIPQALATNMDAGLVWVDRRRRQLAFAGAKISLYASDGEEVQELKGARRAIGDKRRGDYRNIEVPLAPGWTFYLSTDGFLDQAGGEHGFGFGSRRFADMLRDHARQPLPEQAEAFVATLAEYQGEHPQRDDITILSFRFD